MAYELPAMARQSGKRRNITLRPILPTKANTLSLAAILLRPLSIWQAAIPIIMAGYTPPTRDSLTTDSIGDMTAAIDRAAGEVERLIVAVTASLRDWSLRTERWHRGKWSSAVLAGTGIDLSSILIALPVAETLESWLERNVALVRNVSDQTRARIADIVYREFQIGTPPREVAKQISDAVGMGRDRARRIAADQASKLSSQLDAERQLEAGLDAFRYRHGGKLHARPWHKARDGKLYDLKTGKQVGGTDEIDRGDGPGEPPWCSCLRQAYIDLISEVE